jgi:hypothetical protein
MYVRTENRKKPRKATENDCIPELLKTISVKERECVGGAADYRENKR